MREQLHEAPRLHGERSEEHTSELQSQSNLVCRLLLEKKKLSPRPPRGRRLPPLDRGLGRRDATGRRADGRLVRVRDLERAVDALLFTVTRLIATNAPVDR